MAGTTEHFYRGSDGQQSSFNSDEQVAGGHLRYAELKLTDTRRRILSHSCPVARGINNILDKHKPKTVEKAVSLLIEELSTLPEADATINILKRLKGIGDE
jgi:hypothetical protein